ncbi:hypothetical protein [Actinoallomurus sp. CA-142502]|uniref:hypothetical protein n=1 Tax=Actinoallomurus sp. CA-142502 TaxID=3239885 RepID=UPI003D94736E
MAHDQGGRARLWSAAVAAEPRRCEAAPGGACAHRTASVRRRHAQRELVSRV